MPNVLIDSRLLELALATIVVHEADLSKNGPFFGRIRRHAQKNTIKDEKSERKKDAITQTKGEKIRYRSAKPMSCTPQMLH
jgi:hypothetical protein